jgi:hypothetical protein
MRSEETTAEEDINGMNRVELIKNHASKKEAIQRLEVLRRAMAVRLAEIACPYKVGDTIKSDKQKAIIEEINPGYVNEEMDNYTLLITKIKKNGEPYAATSKLRSYEVKHWSLEE